MNLTDIFAICQFEQATGWLALAADRPLTSLVDADEDGHAVPLDVEYAAVYAPDPRITLQWGYRRHVLRGEAVPDWLPQVHIAKHEIRLDQAAILFNGAVAWEHPTAYVDTGAGAGEYVSRPWPLITDDEQVGWGLPRSW